MSKIAGPVHRAENFLKHADRDPDAVLKFHAYETEVLLFDACEAYQQLAGEQVPLLRAFVWWYVMMNPTQFNLPSELASVIQNAGGGYGPQDRSRYFQEILPVLMMTGLARTPGV